MTNKETSVMGTPLLDTPATLNGPVAAADMIVETAPSFAIASMMIASAQSQSRAMEAGVAQLNQTYLAGLATATQCVTRILEDPSRTTLLNAFIAAKNN